VIDPPPPPSVVDLNATLMAQSPHAGGVFALNAEDRDQHVVLTEVDISGVTAKNTAVNKIGDPDTKDGDTWYVGNSNLDNTSDVDQTLSTPSFSLNKTLSLSAAVTKGLTIGQTVSAKLGIDGFEGSYSQSTTVNFSQTDTTTTTEGVTYTSPSQSIKVPAHTTAKVTVNLKSVIASGNVDLHTELGGTYSGSLTALAPNYHHDATRQTPNVPLYDTLCAAVADPTDPALPAALKLNSANKTLDFDGSGTYTAIYGTDYEVKVELTPDSDSSAPNATSPATYTYTFSSANSAQPTAGA
jgi:hypothetical protein